MINGELRIWSEQSRSDGNSFGLQKRAFVRDIDFIDKKLISILTLQEEGKWRRNNDVTTQKLKETLLLDLPAVIKAPKLLSQFLFAVT
jgi:hypothetical protein